MSLKSWCQKAADENVTNLTVSVVLLKVLKQLENINTVAKDTSEQRCNDVL